MSVNMSDDINIYDKMSRCRLEELLDRISAVRAGILGDVCLDAYWHADMRNSKLSRETPHYPLPVVDERMSLGGGANVAANMAALGSESVRVFSAVGPDWRGRELLRLLDEHGIGPTDVITDSSCVTNAYIKPIRKGFSEVAYEDPRLDFASYRPVSREVEDKLISALDMAAESIDVLCVSDQMQFGVVTERVRRHVCGLARKGLMVVADSRNHIGLFSHVITKPNELEGVWATGMEQSTPRDLNGFTRAARMLAEKNGSGVFMTLGARGSLFVDEKLTYYIPAHKINDSIDFCGAGDSSLSGFGLSLAAGAEPWEAAYIAGLCSEVTIRQIGITGTASKKQVLDWHACVEATI